MSVATPSPSPSYIVAHRGDPVVNARHILHGYQCFNLGQYDEAMMFFQLTEADPLQILSLFPDVLPDGLGQPTTRDDGLPSPFAELKPTAAQRHPIAVQKVQGEERLFRALSALIPYLAQIQNRLRLDLETLFTGGTHSVSTTTSSGKHRGGKHDSSMAADRPDPSLALAILVDTVLLKAYLLCDIPLLPFLSSPYNLCDVEEGAKILRSYEKWHELVAFFKFRARHGQALELLAKLSQIGDTAGSGGKANTKPAAGSGGGSGATGGNAHTSQSLQPASAGHASTAGLSGPEPTIKYLQELAINIHQPCYPYSITGDRNHPIGSVGGGSTDITAAVLAYSPALAQQPNPQTIISLVLHFSSAILASDVDDGLRIFTYCHTMNMQPIEPKARSGSKSTSTNGNSGHSPIIVHSYAHHREHCIPSHLVLGHLKQAADREACIAYLESLINNVGETDALFHNELVYLYLESILKLLKAKEQRDLAMAKNQQQQQLSSLNPEALELVSEVPVRRSAAGARGRTGSLQDGNGPNAPVAPVTSSSSSSSSSSAAAASTSLSNGVSGGGRDSSRLHILRRKLLNFLRQSTSYTAEKMLSRFPRHALLEERAILLSRVNQHTQALNIYAHMLHDPLQAEAYAEGFHNQAMAALQQQSAGGASNVAGDLAAAPSVSSSLITQGREMYLNLLQVYLKPPPLGDPADRSSVLHAAGVDVGPPTSAGPVDPPAPMLDAALLLLTKYYDRIAPVGALESLPAETPLQALWPYFEKLLCHQNHTYRDEQITKQLLMSEHYSVKEDWLVARRGRVVCDVNTTCAKCLKKIGQSAFALYPHNGQIVHYVCYSQASGNRPAAPAEPM